MDYNTILFETFSPSKDFIKQFDDSKFDFNTLNHIEIKGEPIKDSIICDILTGTSI